MKFCYIIFLVSTILISCNQNNLISNDEIIAFNNKIYRDSIIIDSLFNELENCNSKNSKKHSSKSKKTNISYSRSNIKYNESSNTTYKSSSSSRCLGTTKSGSRCKRTTKSSSGYCYQHD